MTKLLSAVLILFVLSACSTSVAKLTKPSPSELKEIADLVNGNQPQAALQKIDKRLAENKESPELYYARGLSLLKLGRYSEAEQWLKKTVALYPSFYSAWSDLGIVYDETQRLEEAVTAYSEALKYQPVYFPALKNRGNSLRQLQKFSEAKQDYEAAIKLMPEDFCLKGFYSFVMDALAGKENSPLQGGSLPQRAAYYGCRGIAQAHAGNCPAAIDSYTKAIATKAADSETYNNRGYCRQKLGNLKTASQDFDKAVQLNPSNFQAVKNRDTARQALSN